MLTHAKIKGLKPKDRPYRVAHDRGLCIEVRPTGRKFWRWRYRLNGKAQMANLGRFPEVSREDAETERDRLRLALKAGEDPRHQPRAKPSPTLETVVEDWLELQDVAPATAAKNKWLMGYLTPKLGKRPIASITSKELLDVLREISADKRETAQRLKIKCGQVWQHAMFEEYVEADITKPLKRKLKAPEVKHHGTITEPKKLGKLLRAIDQYDGQFVTVSAMKLTPILFQRPGEIRHATWDQIHWDKAEWRFTSQKTGKPHIVPLSKQAMVILRKLYAVTGRGDYIFPATRKGRPLSNNSINAAFRRMGWNDVTAHGFRACARTLLDEELGFPVKVIEMQLGHQVRDVHGRAYNRTTFLPERKAMMQAWSDYLDTLKD